MKCRGDSSSSHGSLSRTEPFVIVILSSFPALFSGSESSPGMCEFFHCPDIPIMRLQYQEKVLHIGHCVSPVATGTYSQCVYYSLVGPSDQGVLVNMQNLCCLTNSNQRGHIDKHFVISHSLILTSSLSITISLWEEDYILVKNTSCSVTTRLESRYNLVKNSQIVLGRWSWNTLPNLVNE
jgi:hypothetical protein